MAEDLSQTIQEGLSQTLTNLLGFDAKHLETTKVNPKDIKDLQLLEVDAQFEFDKLTTSIRYIIPINSASIIFNTMMGSSEFEIDTQYDDDIVDAMNEFVSNISGSLVTTFNGLNIEELGQSKFHIQKKEIHEENTLENFENTFRFSLELNEQPILLFIKYDEQFLPFIEDISKSEITFHEEEVNEQPEEEIQEEPEEEYKEEETSLVDDISAEPKDDLQIENKDSQSPRNEEIKDTNKESDSQNETTKEENNTEDPKSKKIKLLIIIISGVISLILIVFLALYFLSDEESENNETLTQQQEESKNNSENESPQDLESKKQQTTVQTMKKIDFNIKDINTNRLNKRLETLNKYEILTEEELQKQQLETEKRKNKINNEAKLIEFAKNNKEEPLVIKEPIQAKIEEEIKQEAIKEPVEDLKVKLPQENKKEVIEKNQKLLFITTQNIRYSLFKSFISQTKSPTARLSMCRNSEGKTTIFIGPFQNNMEVKKFDQLVKDSKKPIELSVKEYSDKEFTTLCNF